ncbi:MAG: 16S rRNA (cytosine(1402)-N(4))-methyltransferase RsmH [Planctomycetes bacterium]|nr:16S rRNA (cytosine(1402)-N(4))-methyltransferase RsmH [Planctomycetota bacterium]
MRLERPVAEHTPVLAAAVTDAFSTLPAGASVVDGTVGLGGHASLLLQRGLRVIGLDRDATALGRASGALAGYGGRAVVLHARFGHWLEQARALGLQRVNGLLLDLGVSSPQLDEASRGFSFRADAPLDMRMDTSQGETAAQLIARLPREEFTKILRDFGEERLAWKIAGAVERDPPKTTWQLAEICRRVYPRGYQRIDPATRTFQALRMAVNDELGELERALAGIPEGLEKGGVVAIISFHSLEDRMVKHAFVRWEKEGLARMLKRKPIIADETECASNPRARSAKLRVLFWGEAPGRIEKKAWRKAR